MMPPMLHFFDFKLAMNRMKAELLFTPSLCVAAV
jgi:hypothetical protein